MEEQEKVIIHEKYENEIELLQDKYKKMKTRCQEILREYNNLFKEFSRYRAEIYKEELINNLNLNSGEELYSDKYRFAPTNVDLNLKCGIFIKKCNEDGILPTYQLFIKSYENENELSIKYYIGSPYELSKDNLMEILSYIMNDLKLDTQGGKLYHICKGI